ncbi:lipid II:glycine glycyltransferase FemX [Natronosalvus caseinilyticus]|uniref:lipid II:glycine glycyltransferase FemX n=1 Tax=Natronosalvus caseinilyticus TaxID=2953747 RepID=UPI0028ADBA52|nr:GNAT family N-acetyltransferase [Natronosalvus caseinilyticus]
MGIEIERLDVREDADEWNRYVERADRTHPFYRAESLALQAEDTSTAVHPLVGFKGQEVVGLFPVFEFRKGPITSAFSPAPYSWSCYLGPVTCNFEKLKRRKADRRMKTFLEESLEWIDEHLSPMYAKFESVRIGDVRPFVWNGYEVDPTYTYVVDLGDDPDRLLDTFSGDARSNVRNAEDFEGVYVVEEGSIDDIDRIIEQVRSRYASQGRSFHLSASFVRSLYEDLPRGSVRPYVCRVNGDVQGGILVLESDSTRFRWQGGVKPDADVDLPVNDLLDWHVMRDGLEAGLERYDLVGAGVPSINRYKAKFNPRLETHYTVTSGAFGLDVLIDRYRKRK